MNTHTIESPSDLNIPIPMGAQPATPTTASPHTLNIQQRKTKHSLREVATALRCANGIASNASRYLGCSYTCMRGYLKRWPELIDVAEEATERQLDLTESKLYDGIAKGIPPLIVFYLKTKGQKRGYGDAPLVNIDVDTIHSITMPADFPSLAPAYHQGSTLGTPLSPPNDSPLPPSYPVTSESDTNGPVINDLQDNLNTQRTRKFASRVVKRVPPTPEPTDFVFKFAIFADFWQTTKPFLRTLEDPHTELDTDVRIPYSNFTLYHEYGRVLHA